MLLRMPIEKAVDYTFKQIAQVRQGGHPVFFEKVKRRAITLLLVSLAIPIIIIVRLLGPFITIRFGKLRGDRIGHFASNTELYLCERDAGMHGKNTYDVFYIDGPICNDQLKKMIERTLPISWYVKYLYHANLCLTGYKKYQVPLSKEIDNNNVYLKICPHLSFTEEEEKIGKNGLKKMGIPDDIPFFCFIGRDPAYLKVHFPNQNWDYHNYRDMDINNFVPTVRELTQRGYFAIRMGSVVQKPMLINDYRYVDYATKYRTDSLDIYLSAKCRFFVSGMSGLDSLPMTSFRRPVVRINQIPLLLCRRGCDHEIINIPKKLWLVKERRFMSFREIFAADIMLQTERYKQAGIELIENTPEEITEVVTEMEERLRGVWQTTAEDEELQRRFNTLFQTYKKNEESKQFKAYIGTEFLRQNVELLE